ncbi:MAG: 2-keto-3-deoxygluconate permease [Aliidongia sp.]
MTCASSSGRARRSSSPFMAFTLGQKINLANVITGGLPGIGLGILVFAVTGFVCIMADKLLGGSGIAGAAASSRRAIPQRCRRPLRRPTTTYAAIAPIATVQIATSVIVTAVLTPLLTAWMFRRVQAQRAAATVPPASQPIAPGAESRPVEGAL